MRASSLVKRFDATCAVDGVDLVVQEGEVRGLLGPNGAGKTTLLRMLFGLVQPDHGSIELFDRPLDASDSASLDGVAGFVEDPSFYPYLSGRANLELLAELDRNDARAQIDGLLELVGLRTRAADRVNGYSTGMRQRLGIAAALLRAPRLLLLDEPTGGLDPAGVREVGTLVRELSSQGAAIVLSSHQIGEVEELCDSFTVLRRGRVVWNGSAAQLRAQAPAPGYALATSDDQQALAIAAREPGVEAGVAQGGNPAHGGDLTHGGDLAHGGDLTITVQEGYLDPYVLALGRAGVAVRRLELLLSPLESMFFALAGEPPSDDRPGRSEQAAASR